MSRDPVPFVPGYETPGATKSKHTTEVFKYFYFPIQIMKSKLPKNFYTALAVHESFSNFRAVQLFKKVTVDVANHDVI